MKQIILFCLLVFTTCFFAEGQIQNSKPNENSINPIKKEESAFRLFLNNASRTRINKDWSLLADFRSGN